MTVILIALTMINSFSSFADINIDHCAEHDWLKEYNDSLYTAYSKQNIKPKDTYLAFNGYKYENSLCLAQWNQEKWGNTYWDSIEGATEFWNNSESYFCVTETEKEKILRSKNNVFFFVDGDTYSLSDALNKRPGSKPQEYFIFDHRLGQLFALQLMGKIAKNTKYEICE